MATQQDPFNMSGMAANLATPSNDAPQPQYQQPQYQQYQQQQPPPQQQQYYQQPPPQQQQMQQPPQAFDAQQPPQQQQQQLVVAAQPSNPYAGMVAPHQQQQQQPSPWDAPTGPNSSFVALPPTRSSTASAASFDPFAAPPPAPAPAPVVAPPPQQQQQQQVFSAAPAPVVQDPWSAAPPSQDFSTPSQQQQYQAQPPPPNETQIVPAQAPPQQHYHHQQQQQQQQSYHNQDQQSSSYSNNNYSANQSYGNDAANQRQMVSAPPSSVVVRDDGGNDDDKSRNNKSPRNPYSNALSQQVSGSNCSGLPKAELVGKKGFVLSRISFRTIVMKKWKQSFWVQYGGHTMLWFRSQGDFDDWLNNPYHTQMQRNFLIKLAINFVHDLYKPNVRGYQVTQCRTKPYGNNKVVRQFKLERWMDYGPTIAAAFGSYDPKEVDACREAIVECMKNTPLDNGIRATGAVKEHHDRQQKEEFQKSQIERQLKLTSKDQQQQQQQQNGGGGNGGGYQNYSLDNNNVNGTNGSSAARAHSMTAPSFDLLGDSNVGGYDDSASVPPTTHAASTGDLLFGDVGSGALVPAVNPNATYPEAPLPPAAAAPPTYYPPAQPQMQQQQGYPTQPQADPATYGAPIVAPVPQGYPGQPQQRPQYQQQQPHYPPQAQAPAFAQQPQPDYGGYPQQQQQQQPGGYPAASYPVPAQQF